MTTVASKITLALASLHVLSVAQNCGSCKFGNFTGISKFISNKKQMGVCSLNCSPQDSPKVSAKKLPWIDLYVDITYAGMVQKVHINRLDSWNIRSLYSNAYITKDSWMDAVK